MPKREVFLDFIIYQQVHAYLIQCASGLISQ